MSAVSAGSRGVGYWKTRNLETDQIDDQETVAAIELCGLYLKILDPLLIGGRVEGHLPVDVAPAHSEQQANPFQPVSARSPKVGSYESPPPGPDAAIISRPGTSLILAAFWDDSSQYVPQALSVPRASMLVSATETASAWQVNLTGLRGIRRQRTAGGLKLDLMDFDQVATVLVTSDSQLQQEIEQRVQQNSARAAQLMVDLARFKLQRVKAVCAEIDSGPAGGDPEAASLLDSAARHEAMATAELGQGQLGTAEQLAKSCMRELRQVEQRYWNRATQSLSTPESSPHTLNFATLPDHWEMLHRIQQATPSENLLTDGGFNLSRQLSQHDWKRTTPQEDLFQTSAEIVSEVSAQGSRENHVLQLRAWKRSQDGRPGSRLPSLLVSVPEVQASAGDLFEVSGRIRLGSRLRIDQQKPFLVFDSELGPEFAVRPVVGSQWSTFRLFRQASQTGPFRIWLATSGSAEIFIDDVMIVRRGRADLPSQRTQQ
ncbi:MAG: hypothetical protein R3C49_23390 [Planctomycetaceae bacterium]